MLERPRKIDPEELVAGKGSDGLVGDFLIRERGGVGGVLGAGGRLSHEHAEVALRGPLFTENLENELVPPACPGLVW